MESNQLSNTPNILQRIYAARGIQKASELNRSLGQLISPYLLGGIDQAANIIADAVIGQQYITIAGDYDCDGATGTTIGYRGLRLLGAQNVRTIVPDRAVHGYGLTPGLVDAMSPDTQLIVTVDSGTSSVEGVKHAQSKGMRVVVTDHHLPGDALPTADAIVNPNLKGDLFPSRFPCGAAVLFFVLIAVRRELRIRGYYHANELPDLTSLLPIVAIGTIADLVSLDQNNRILIHNGLQMIRNGHMPIGLRMMIQLSGKNHQTLVASDIAFSIAPILNAAGRIETMDAGVKVLCTDDAAEAETIVRYLLDVNARRKEKQASMVTEAEELVVGLDSAQESSGVTVYSETWHPGIVGLVASKLKESLHRPVFAFAPAMEGSTELRGSGRSVEGVHLRDVLAEIDATNPGLIPKFGGHAMAAGMSLDVRQIERFKTCFDQTVAKYVNDDILQKVILTDGELDVGELSLETAQLLRSEGPWGQAFPEPVFEGTFDVIDYKILKDVHLKLELAHCKDGTIVDAIHFFGYTGQPIPTRIRIAYELSVNEFRDRLTLQLLIRHLEETA